MSSAPFDVSVIADKLKVLLQEKNLVFVGTSAEYSKLTDLTSAPTPSAYVLLGKETPNDNPVGTRQSVNVNFGVVIVARDLSSHATNIQNVKQLANPVIGAVRDLLIGKTVQFIDGVRPVTWVGGQTLGFQNGVLVWIDSFQTQHFIGSR
ncbi:hypothetical protein A9G22_01550 [Gilliamella sp. App2-1]|jgi:hypothetical protein|uniref:phage tail terminator protein n=1 Tax=Gilliamella sp. App2-1 TaxID=3120230 RepID=UPI000828645E|nr:hypothetical protein [Gilliamella apicola]OCG20028.1 hypothetical protein A9G22_01550 [Gilliamella apicola]